MVLMDSVNVSMDMEKTSNLVWNAINATISKINV